MNPQKGLKADFEVIQMRSIKILPSSALLLVVSDAASGVAVSPFTLLPLPSWPRPLPLDLGALVLCSWPCSPPPSARIQPHSGFTR